MVVFWWVLVAGFALLDWHAVAAHRTRVETWAKPATMVALAAVAVAMGATDHAPGRWLILALVLGLAGDVFLLGDAESRFLGGLAAFLVGHLAYVAAFVALGLGRPAWAAVGALVLAAALVLGRGIIPATARAGGVALAGPVAAYMAVIGAMVVTSWMTGDLLVGVGAAVFVASDTVLALDRFVAPRRWAHLAVMVTYHLGQALIVVGVLSSQGG